MNQIQLNELELKIKKDYGNIAGIVVMKEGHVCYETYFNGFHSNDPFHVFSVTKSIVSILFGIAMDQGYIKSIDQKVLEFFPEYSIKRGEKTIQKITIRDMLTMSVPYKFKYAPYTKYFTSEDWVKSALDLLGGKRTKIGEFKYAPLVGPDILTGILTKATKQSVLTFANQNLFLPLGINEKSAIVFQDKEEQLAFVRKNGMSGWVADPKGVNTAGWGLTLTAMEMAKIGQLYLDQGVVNEQRVVSKEWIKESTKEHIRWKELDLPFGYLWWVQEDGYAAMGDGGNIIYVNRKQKIVVSIVSTFKARVLDRLDFIKQELEPLFLEE